jgi:hypothetical protein
MIFSAPNQQPMHYALCIIFEATPTAATPTAVTPTAATRRLQPFSPQPREKPRVAFAWDF